jgi:hypothetical protein
MTRSAGERAALQMLQNAADDLWVLDAGDDLERRATLRAALDLDPEHPLQALHGEIYCVK